MKQEMMKQKTNFARISRTVWWSSLIFAACFATARAQIATGGSYTLDQSIVASGGGASANGGTFSVDGTIGQSVAGGPQANPPFQIYSGFWSPDGAVVNPPADLSVVKTDLPDVSVGAGENIVYTINFVNNSTTGNAVNVLVTDALPANTTYVSAAILSGTGWTKTEPGAGSGTGSIVFSKATAAANEAAQFQVVVKVNPGTVVGTIISNTATAASGSPDPVSNNNAGTAQTTVVCNAAAPAISANPSTVAANSIGNTANTPAGAGSYSWTISNGLITSAANAPTITYSSGSSGDVTLSLTVIDSGGCAAGSNLVVPITGTPPTFGAGSVLISEFRTRGELGADDEYIEFYNNSNAAVNIGGLTVRVKEGSGSITAPTTLATLQPGATVPARGHYLLRKAGAGNYSLAAYAEADQTYSGAIGDDHGIALFSNPTVFDASTLIDATGFQSITDSLFKEGAGLAPANGITEDGQFSFVRKVTANGLRDNADNNSDFVFVSNTGGIFSGKTSILGAPGPENSRSPLTRTSQFAAQLIEPTTTSVAAPNRIRNPTQTALIETPNIGTIEFRRRWINNTGQTITKLRFRIVDTTTKNSPLIFTTQADLRSVSSTDFSVVTSRGTLTIKGLTLEMPSDQGTTGGGQNSSLTVALPAAGLPPGEAINVNFTAGIKTGGSFRFDIFIEALP